MSAAEKCDQSSCRSIIRTEVVVRIESYYADGEIIGSEELSREPLEPDSAYSVAAVIIASLNTLAAYIKKNTEPDRYLGPEKCFICADARSHTECIPYRMEPEPCSACMERE